MVRRIKTGNIKRYRAMVSDGPATSVEETKAADIRLRKKVFPGSLPKDTPRENKPKYAFLSAKGRKAISKAAKKMWAKKKAEKQTTVSSVFPASGSYSFQFDHNTKEWRDVSGQSPQTVLSTPEAVNHPQHYMGDTTYEVIKVLEAWDLDKSFCLGNTVKYIARHKQKGTPLEDLKKAAWYLNREIQNLESQNLESQK